MAVTKRAFPKQKRGQPRKCIFCCGTPISKEHVFAEWMRPYLPKGSNSQFVTLYDYNSDTVVTQPGPLNRKGEAASQKLKVVCIPCNIGWMSDIQKATKPILLPLLLGGKKMLGPEKRKMLATWATMFAMVYETTNPIVAAATPAQRKTFMQERSPPEYWQFWCAPYLDGCAAIHSGFASYDSLFRPIIETNTAPAHKAQMTLCGAGAVSFLIFGAADEIAYKGFAAFIERFAQAAGFVELWPPTGSSIRVDANRVTPLVWSHLVALRDDVLAQLRVAHSRGRT